MFIFCISRQEKINDKNVGNQPVTSMGNQKAVANKPIIAKNPLLIGRTFYDSIYINSSTDVMTQHVSQFGRETTAWSILGMIRLVIACQQNQLMRFKEPDMENVQ